MATADLDSLDVLINEAFGPLRATRADFAPVPPDAWFDAMRDQADAMALAERSTPEQLAGTVVTRRLGAYRPCNARIATAILARPRHGVGVKSRSATGVAS